MEAITNLLQGELDLWNGAVEVEALDDIQRAALHEQDQREQIYHAQLVESEHCSFAPEPDRSDLYNAEFGIAAPDGSTHAAFISFILSCMQQNVQIGASAIAELQYDRDTNPRAVVEHWYRFSGLNLVAHLENAERGTLEAMQHMNHEPQLSSWAGAEFKEWKDQRAEKVISKEVIAAKDAELAMKDVQMADKDAKIAILEARVAELEGRGSAAGYDGGDDDDGNKYNTEQGTDEEDWMAGEESFEYDEISENGLSEDDESMEDELAFEDLLANDEKVTVQQKAPFAALTQSKKFSPCTMPTLPTVRPEVESLDDYTPMSTSPLAVPAHAAAPPPIVAPVPVVTPTPAIATHDPSRKRSRTEQTLVQAHGDEPHREVKRLKH